MTINEVNKELDKLYWNYADSKMQTKIAKIQQSVIKIVDNSIAGNVSARTAEFTSIIEQFDKTVMPDLKQLIAEIKQIGAVSTAVDASLTVLEKIMTGITI